jgi:hypothetical protein
LYELLHTVASAKKYLAELGLSRQIDCQEGSFFDQVPAGLDLYLLKRILHDWNDEQCIKILTNCKRAMLPNSKLLIMEMVVPEGNVCSFGKEIDILLLVVFGGKERTA